MKLFTSIAPIGWLQPFRALFLVIYFLQITSSIAQPQNFLDPNSSSAIFSPDWAEPVAPPISEPALPESKSFGPVVPAARQPTGALTGRIVFMNAGHGWTYDPSYWRLQRGTVNQMNEDYGNLDQLNFFAAYCFNAGAVIVSLRPLGQQTNEVVLDNDDPGVTWSGTWFDSTSPIFYGSAGDVPYRYAGLASSETATATYTPNIPMAGYYPVYTWVRAGSDRGDQLYRIRHTGGESQLRIPHYMVGNGWIYLGEYYFNAGANSAIGSVIVSNLRGSTNGIYTFADAIRFGNGMGSVDRGGGVSGYPREDENCRYWIQASLGQGQSSSLYDGAGADESDSWSAPGKMSAEMNREEAGSTYKRIHISFHSNAGGGRGTLGLITGTPTSNQTVLAQLCGKQVNDELVGLGSPPLEVPWFNRSTYTYTGGYSEIDGSLFNYEMDATIIEVAFHDNVDDAKLLRDPKARAAIGRAAMHAVVKYMNQFDGVPLIFPPEPPINVRAAGSADGSILISWAAPVSSGGSGPPSGYVIYRSTNGYGFGNPITVSNITSFRIHGLPSLRDYYFRVAAVNAGGESLPSEVVGCRTPPETPAPRVLIVNAYDRFSRSLNLRQNTTARAWAPPGANGTIDRVLPRRMNSFDYVVSHGRAVSAFGLPFDSCQNEAVASGEVPIGDYRILSWACGAESTEDETFSAAEQAAIASFQATGGHLFVSGSEIAWDLDRASGPTAADRSFFNNQLKAHLLNDTNDDSNSYAVSSVSNSIFADRPGASFDDGSGGIYWVQTPDVLTPVGVGVTSALTYTGNTNGAAVLQYDGSAGGGKLVYFGFPFETITSASRRNQFMADILQFFTADTATLLSAGSIWKFNDSGLDFGTSWSAPGFDDQSWPAGPAQLGFGDGDEATLLDTNRARITTYFRRVFTVVYPNELDQVTLRLKRDDGTVVYLNGLEVFRSNMPTGNITASTFASTTVGGADESTWYTASINPDLLSSGTNWLAVELHQPNLTSSDLSFDLELLATLKPATPVALAPRGSAWRYKDDGMNLGVAWRTPNYNDMLWKSGPAMLGFGDANGILPTTLVASNNQITTYFRRQFYVPAAALVRTVTANLLRDDGAVVYLNGTEVWRDNLPESGPIAYTNLALSAIGGAAETSWLSTSLDPSLLVDGTNLLAVEIHQNNTNSSDISFDFELKATAFSYAPTLTLLLSPGQITLQWPASAGFFALYTTTNLASTTWDPVLNQRVLTNNQWTVTLPLTPAASHFFRLHPQ